MCAKVSIGKLIKKFLCKEPRDDTAVAEGARIVGGAVFVLKRVVPQSLAPFSPAQTGVPTPRLTS
jgi:hypothetical protein